MRTPKENLACMLFPCGPQSGVLFPTSTPASQHWRNTRTTTMLKQGKDQDPKKQKAIYMSK